HGADYNLADLRLDAEHIHQMIAELPEMPRRVFNLYVIDSYSHKEIAGMLEMSENTSRWYLAQARKTLQARLAAYTKQQINVKA
ncbi:MAG: sigma-70 region 4 domain-containing protein, partial [Saprospiraceae bacterium]|nr:sigma-70 region 4 domain-containing protein [Saprospiraceae bacterium]